jgi:hypothetical protein
MSKGWRGVVEQVGWIILAEDGGEKGTNWLVPRLADSHHIGQFVWMMAACMAAAGISCGLC